jgi:hypothetical protein
LHKTHSDANRAAAAPGSGGRPIMIETRFEQVHGGIRNRFGQVPAAKSLREPDPAPFCGKVGDAPVARFN